MDFDHGLVEALEELIEEERLKPGTAAHGVAVKYLHDAGDHDMSERQRYVLNSVVLPLLREKCCEICGEFGTHADGRRLCADHRRQIEVANKDD